MHDDGQLRQRPFDAGNIAPQFGELALQGRGGNAGRQQFSQPAGGGHFLKIEVRQPAHFFGRLNEPAAVPAAYNGQRNAQEVGEHGGRIQPMDVVFFVEQSQALPKLAFANDFSFAGFDGGLCGLVKERRKPGSAASGSSSPITMS